MKTIDKRVVELISEWGARKAHGEPTHIEDLCAGDIDLMITLRLALCSSPCVESGRVEQPHPVPDGPTVASDQAGFTEGFVTNEGLAGIPKPKDLGRLGPYRIDDLLGAGGMGAVFRAWDESLNRSVALKVLRPSLAHDPRAQERFLREARAAAALEHDHIVTIYQVGEDRGIPFLAMPLLSGESLEDRLSRDRVLPISEALRIGREIAEGLDAAHGRKVIHRDIKPANIWLEGARGRVKILDFGLARATDEAKRLTQEDTILGTPAYMAPEQALASRNLDTRLDLFSLGAVLYRMITGRPPFAGAGPLPTLVALVHADPAPPSGLNPDISTTLNALILYLLAKDPAHRPQTARAVVEAITAIESGTQVDLPIIRLEAPNNLVPIRSLNTAPPSSCNAGEGSRRV